MFTRKNKGSVDPVVAIIVGLLVVGGGILITSSLMHQTSVQPAPQQQVAGASAGPTNPYPVTTTNGVTEGFASVGLFQGSTTVCVVRSPLSATSSLQIGQVGFAIAPTTTQALTVTTSNDASGLVNAVTIGGASATANLGSPIVFGATSTPLVPGNSYIRVTTGSAVGVWAQRGACSIELLSSIPLN